MGIRTTAACSAYRCTIRARGSHLPLTCWRRRTRFLSGDDVTDIVQRLRHLASMGLSIADEAADAIEHSGTAQMRDALAWYGERGNWRRPTQGRSWSNSPAADDRGSLARHVLMEHQP